MPRRAELTISKRTVDGLSVEARDAVFWDRELAGFGVRVYPSGRKIYVVQSRGPGGSKRITLGRHGELTVEQARKQAVAVIDRIKRGEAPVAAPPEPAFTVADLAERYMEVHVAVNCNAHTQGIYRGSLDNHILPALGKMPVASVWARPEAAALHYGLRNTPRAANRALMVLSKMFSLAEDWGLAPAGGNPCRFVRKYKEGMRERFLAEHEYRRIGCELCVLEAEGPLPARAAAALRLLMLTGCRLNEILTLRWDDVDRKAGELRLRDAKTGARMVPLTPTAIDVLAGIDRVPRSSWVFAGAYTGQASVAALHVLASRAGAGRGGRRADPRFAAFLRQQGPGARREPDHDRAASRAHRCREHGALCAPGAGRREDRGGPGGRQHRGRHPARQGRRSGRWGSVSAD